MTAGWYRWTDGHRMRYYDGSQWKGDPVNPEQVPADGSRRGITEARSAPAVSVAAPAVDPRTDGMIRGSATESGSSARPAPTPGERIVQVPVEVALLPRGYALSDGTVLPDGSGRLNDGRVLLPDGSVLPGVHIPTTATEVLATHDIAVVDARVLADALSGLPFWVVGPRWDVLLTFQGDAVECTASLTGSVSRIVIPGTISAETSFSLSGKDNDWEDILGDSTRGLRSLQGPVTLTLESTEPDAWNQLAATTPTRSVTMPVLLDGPDVMLYSEEHSEPPSVTVVLDPEKADSLVTAAQRLGSTMLLVVTPGSLIIRDGESKGNYTKFEVATHGDASNGLAKKLGASSFSKGVEFAAYGARYNHNALRIDFYSWGVGVRQMAANSGVSTLPVRQYEARGLPM